MSIIAVSVSWPVRLRVVATLTAALVTSAAMSPSAVAAPAPSPSADGDGVSRGQGVAGGPGVPGGQRTANGYSTAFTPAVPDPTTATAAELAVAQLAAGRPAAGQAAPSPGGTITRDQVMARARSWIDESVPYNQSGYWTDGNGTYRQDCSGFISMAWDLPSSASNDYGETTWTLPRFATQLGSLDDLKPGDMIDLTTEHVVLFKAWTDASHTTAGVLEEAHSGTNAREITISRTYLTSNDYQPYRYGNIVDTAPAPAGTGWGHGRAQG